MNIAHTELPYPHMAPLVAQAAGQADVEQFWLNEATLYVRHVTQPVLDQALATVLASFDPLDQPRAAALASLNAAYEAEFATIKAQYPDSERESWPIQLREAEVLASDPDAVTPYLNGLITQRGFGETAVELAVKVQAKNLAYGSLSSSLTGKRHRLEHQILTATTVEQVQAVVW